MEMILPGWQEAVEYGLEREGLFLLVDVDAQELRVYEDSILNGSYTISTSWFGLGCLDGSMRTPPGWHDVRERIGADAPLGQVFRNRQATDKVIPSSGWRSPTGGDDLVLSRILRLHGLEEGMNQGTGCDSYDRYIYIHGTNHEHRLGEPASHGCVQMANEDVIELFARIGEKPALCWIGRPQPAIEGLF